MSNPAYLLADLLNSWAVPSHTTPENTRSNADPSSMPFWSEHALAVRYLGAIESALTALEASGSDMSFYRETIPSWYSAVFAYTFPWKSSSTQLSTELLSEENFRLLRAVGAQIQTVGWVPLIGDEQAISIREAFSDAEILILDDREVSPEIKQYLLGLVSEAKTVLDLYAVHGTVPVRQKIMELGGAMSTVSEMQKTQEGRSRWSSAARKVLVSVTYLAGSTAITTGVTNVMNALTES